MKNEEALLVRERNPYKPEIKDLSSMDDCIQTQLQSNIDGFDPQDYINKYENSFKEIFTIKDKILESSDKVS